MDIKTITKEKYLDGIKLYCAVKNCDIDGVAKAAGVSMESLNETAFKIFSEVLAVWELVRQSDCRADPDKIYELTIHEPKK